MNYYIHKDPLTGMQNFIRFFTDDFPKVYGNYGHILYIKIDNLKSYNANYGRESGDDLLRIISSYINSKVTHIAYRHEGNGFIIVFKEINSDIAEAHSNELQSFLNESITESDKKEMKVSTHILPYNKPIQSVADYYTLFYDTYINEKKLKDGKEMMHFLLEKLSYRVNDLIGTYTNVREFALSDDISKLPNYKSAKLYMDEILCSSSNYAILFIDGDRLSEFNQISYELGNKAIFEIASVLTTSIRSDDKVFRWLSGDEFIVVAQNITKSETEDLAERIRKNVELHQSSLPYQITVSIGISMYPETAETLQEALKTSELAIREAKSSGKNKCCFYDSYNK